MSRQPRMVNAVDPEGNWLYRAGGISALVLGVGYIVIIALYVPVGAPPSGAEARLAYLAGNTTAWWAILGLSVLTDLLFIPVAFALYLALKGIHRDAMLVATACVVLFVILDLAITWTNYAALITLSSGYAAATNDAQKVAFLAAANYSSMLLESSLLGVYIILIPAIGFLIIGLVMLKGIFTRITAYLGVAAGILGIVSVAGPIFMKSLGAMVVLASALTTVWVLFAGYRLYRLGQPREPGQAYVN